MSASPKDPLPSPQDNVKPLDYKEQFAKRKVATKFTDPCEAAAKASMECLNRNNYNRDACLEYFQVYRDCKNTWIQLTAVREWTYDNLAGHCIV